MIVAYRSTPAQSCDDLNEFLLLLETVLEIVLLRFVPSAHFGKELHRAQLVRRSLLPGTTPPHGHRLARASILFALRSLSCV